MQGILREQSPSSGRTVLCNMMIPLSLSKQSRDACMSINTASVWNKMWLCNCILLTLPQIHPESSFVKLVVHPIRCKKSSHWFLRQLLSHLSSHCQKICLKYITTEACLTTLICDLALLLTADKSYSLQINTFLNFHYNCVKTERKV